MPNLKIDGKIVQAPEGATLLDAAGMLGIEIPTLCFMKGLHPATSCMVCVVKVEGRRNLVPACATKVQEGMEVLSDNEAIHQARRVALELLLSDHVGDCMGPCQMACPAHMDIPLMIRQIAAGKWDEAIETVLSDIALPAVAGRICSAPCEKTCRREQVDQAVAICLLKRFVADVDLEQVTSESEPVPVTNPKRVAIVGAGPAGLACAYYLQKSGIACTIFDDRDEPGGMLRYGVSEADLPCSVIDGEVSRIRALGVEFKSKIRVGRDLTLVQLREEFGAVFLAPGQLTRGDLASLGFDPEQDKPKVKAKTYETEMPGVFAGGDVWRKRKMVIRSLADGKEAALAIQQYLAGEVVTGPSSMFNSRMGSLSEKELESLAGPASSKGRFTTDTPGGGFTEEQARAEALRCLHCDCRKPEACQLRIHAQTYGAKSMTFKGTRRDYALQDEHPNVVFESGKCINCGICVQLTEMEGDLGLTFVGRGFDVRVAVPFARSMDEALARTARKVVEACPTGALSLK